MPKRKPKRTFTEKLTRVSKWTAKEYGRGMRDIGRDAKGRFKKRVAKTKYGQAKYSPYKPPGSKVRQVRKVKRMIGARCAICNKFVGAGHTQAEARQIVSRHIQKVHTRH